MNIESPPLDRKCVLCVEPHSDICLLLSKILHTVELEVRHVPTIKETLTKHLHGKSQPALIIIDNSFFDREIGLHITAIKTIAPSSKVLIISSIDEAMETALSAGADRFLTKPFTMADLLNTVLSMLGMRQML